MLRIIIIKYTQLLNFSLFPGIFPVCWHDDDSDERQTKPKICSPGTASAVCAYQTGTISHLK